MYGAVYLYVSLPAPNSTWTSLRGRFVCAQFFRRSAPGTEPSRERRPACFAFLPNDVTMCRGVTAFDYAPRTQGGPRHPRHPFAREPLALDPQMKRRNHDTVVLQKKTRAAAAAPVRISQQQMTKLVSDHDSAMAQQPRSNRRIDRSGLASFAKAFVNKGGSNRPPHVKRSTHQLLPPNLGPKQLTLLQARVCKCT